MNVLFHPPSLHHRYKNILDKARLFWAVPVIVLCSSDPVHAATYYWDNNGTTAGFGTAGGTWSSAGTTLWSGNATGGADATLSTTVTTGPADQVNFGTNTSGLASGTITVAGTVDIRSISVGSQSGAITLNGGTLTINATNNGFITNNSPNTLTINSDIVLSAGSPSTRNVTGNVTLTGTASGAGGFTPVSGAVLTLSGNGSGINLGGAGRIVVGASNLTWGTFSNTGVLDLNGNNFTVGNMQSTSGTITDNSTSAGTSTLTATNANTNTYSGTITDGTSKKVAFVHTGSGVLTLASANTFSGTTAVTNAGTNKLVLGNNLALQNSAIDTSTSANSAFSLASGITTPTIGGLTGSKNLSTVFAGNATTFGQMTSLTLNTFSGSNYTYSGNITDGAAGMTLTKNGTGMQFLSGNNTYTGATTINAGTLQLAKTASLYNGTSASWTASNVSVASGGALALNVGGTGEFSTGNVTTILTNLGGLGGSVNNNGLRSGSQIAFDTTNAAGSSFTIADTIANSTGTGGGAISLAKLGANTLVLSANNSYSGGTTIATGTLSLTGASGSAGSGNISISSGAALQLANSASTSVANNLSGSGDVSHTSAFTTTLSGSNTNAGALRSTGGGTLLFSGANALSTSITSLNATSSSTLSLADGATRTITLGSSGISLSTAALSFDVDLSAGTSDRLNFGGAATLTGTNSVNLSFLNSISAPQTWTLLTASSGLAGTWNLGSYSQQAGYAFSLSSNATSLWLTANISTTDAFWTGAGGTSWTATNFSSTINGSASIAGSALTALSDVKFAATGAGNLTTTLGANYTIGTLTDSTSEVAINGSNTLTVNSSAINAINISATGNTTIGANLAGFAGLTKSGSGTLTLSGNNSYSGGSTIIGGTVVIGTSTAFGNSNGTITLNPGGGNTATLQSGANNLTVANSVILSTGTTAFDTNFNNASLAGVVSGSGEFVKSGAGTLTLNGTNTYTGATTINAGTLSIASITNGGVSGALGNSTNSAANLVLGGGILEYTGSSNGSTDRNFTLTAGTSSTISVTTAATSLTISGNAANTTGALTKAGSGILTLSGNNSYTGDTTITAGTLQIASTGLLAGGSYSGNMTNSGVFLFASNSNQTLSGILSGSGSLTKNGTGALTLSGSNSYSGGSTFNGGTIRIGNNNALGTGNWTTNNNVTLASSDSTARTITANYTSILGTGVTITLGEASGGTGNLTFTGSGNLNIGSGVTRTLNVINTTSITQALISGANTNLTKTGIGTLILSANNTYTGATTINAGTLQIGNGGTSGALALTSTITNNATLVFNRSDSVVQGTHFSGSAITGSGSIIQNGTGNLTLSAVNTYTGNTTINSGTLTAAAAGAVGSSAKVTINNGGSFLVTADDAIGTSTGIELNGGTLAFGAAGYSGAVGALTLSANSTIDLGTSSNGVLIQFNGINWNNANAMLSIYNWTGTTLWQGGTGSNTDQIYFTNSTLTAQQLQQISFYSDFGQSFLGTAFQISGGTYDREIIAVPEPGGYFAGSSLVAFLGINLLWRGRRPKALGSWSRGSPPLSGVLAEAPSRAKFEKNAAKDAGTAPCRERGPHDLTRGLHALLENGCGAKHF
ncbi:MAG: autotransporter-associated beta strand repeat-containing protein [bacterium]